MKDSFNNGKLKQFSFCIAMKHDDEMFFGENLKFEMKLIQKIFGLLLLDDYVIKIYIL